MQRDPAQSRWHGGIEPLLVPWGLAPLLTIAAAAALLAVALALGLLPAGPPGLRALWVGIGPQLEAILLATLALSCAVAAKRHRHLLPLALAAGLALVVELLMKGIAAGVADTGRLQLLVGVAISVLLLLGIAGAASRSRFGLSAGLATSALVGAVVIAAEIAVLVGIELPGQDGAFALLAAALPVAGGVGLAEVRRSPRLLTPRSFLLSALLLAAATGLSPLGIGDPHSRQGAAMLLVVTALLLLNRAVIVAYLYRPYRELRAMAQRQRELAERFRGLLNAAPLGIVVVGDDDRIREHNPAASRLLGRASLADEPLSRYVPHLPRGTGGEIEGTAAWRADGSRLEVDVSQAMLRDATADARLLFLRDASQRQAYVRELEWLARHDALTRMPNRMALQLLLEERQRRGDAFTLLLLGLDAMPRLNASFGQQVGDALLRAFAARLRGLSYSDGFVARCGGEQFAMVFGPGMRLPEIEAQVMSVLRSPLEVDGGLRLQLQPHAGLLRVGPHDHEELCAPLQAAEQALLLARRRGPGAFVEYSPGMLAEARRGIELEQALQVALERDEFLLHYQPRVDARDGRMVGVEALLRWQGPLGGVSPAEFIPIAEQGGRIVELGRWAIDAALRDWAAWRATYGWAPPVAVNLSPRQLADGGLFDVIGQALRLHGAPPEALELEITESAAMEHLDWVLPRLQALQALGLRIAIDDFGTGYSSLARLQQLPASVLKVDIAFVRGIGTPAGDALLETILEIGQRLGKRVVCEGVETEAQAAWLRARGCDEMQGWLFDRAMPADELARRLDQASKPPLAGDATASPPAMHARQPLSMKP